MAKTDNNKEKSTNHSSVQKDLNTTQVKLQELSTLASANTEKYCDIKYTCWDRSI